MAPRPGSQLLGCLDAEAARDTGQLEFKRHPCRISLGKGG